MYMYIIVCVYNVVCVPRLLLCALLQCCIMSLDVQNGPLLQLNEKRISSVFVFHRHIITMLLFHVSF